uniref:Uncharacterized protein n=1 Tax=Oncorhynchus tshawytscha TaxID=74940 RepID=A0A8C8MNE2_ONCTS
TIEDFQHLEVVNWDPSDFSLCVCSQRLKSLPEKPVVIDWSYFKTEVARAGMVDEFEKKVEPFRK